MPEQEATITPVAFEDVAVGDTLTFQTRDNGFSGSGGFVQRTGKVTQVTERSVTVACGHSLNYVPGSSTGNARLRRADWYDRHVQRVDSFDVGSVVYVVNGRRNAAHEAWVRHRDDETITVYNTAKDELQPFDVLSREATGGPFKGEPPYLAAPSDPLVRELVAKQWNTMMAEQVKRLVELFKAEPTTENYAQLLSLVEEWGSSALEGGAT